MNTNTEKTPRITKAMRFAEIREMVPADRTDLLDFIDHEIELLSRKNRADRKPTKRQVADEELRERLYNSLAENGGSLTVTEMMATFPEFSATEGMSNQKVTALLSRLLDMGRVIKTLDHGRSRFAASVA